MDSIGTHRPRNVGWARAAALLYGDWGTSKAYVIGLAFLAAGYSSFPIILAVCGLTGLVGYNYIIVCKHFPDGGGVYSAAREQSRVLAVLGSLLLVADFIVTAAMSGWDAMSYLGISKAHIKAATLGFIFLIGFINFFGPKHSGSIAVVLAIPTVIVVVGIIILAAPHFTFHHLKATHESLGANWTAFVSVILALSGVEAVANLTGVLKLDSGATPDRPVVGKTARKAIIPVAIEVVLGTALLGLAMLSMPDSVQDTIKERYTDMLRYLGEYYATETWHSAHAGQVVGWIVGLVVGLLLLSAVNTAVGAMIGLIYMLARDREMPRPFTRLNYFGVPFLPLMVAVGLPSVLVIISDDLDSLADMYAIGVVGAITVNLGSCVFNQQLALKWWDRGIMGVTFLILFAVEVTIAHTKPAALFFAVCVVGIGFFLRFVAMKRAGLETVTVAREVAAMVKPEIINRFRPNLTPGQAILVAARGFTPVLRFALEEAQLRQGSLYVLYVKELVVSFPGPLGGGERPRWQDDRQAAEIMYGMIDLGKENDVPVLPIYVVSDNPAAVILDISATLGIDVLLLGSPHRHRLVALLKGDVVTEVARSLPENIQLLIFG